MCPRSWLNHSFIALICLTFLPSCTSASDIAPEKPIIPTSTDTIEVIHTQPVSETLTSKPSPSWTPTTTVTSTTIPTPALRTPATRTLAPAAFCPEPSEETSTIEPISPYQEDYAGQILDYLNTHGSANGLESALNLLKGFKDETAWWARAKVVTEDVTGDTSPEVIVDLVFDAEGEYGPLLVNLYIFSCHEGQYEVRYKLSDLGAKFSGPDTEAGAGLRAIRDMNLDGVPEIVFSYLYVHHGVVTIWPEMDYARFFYIIQWDKNDFVNMIQDEESPFTSVFNGDGSIRDTDGNGTLELVLSHGASRESGLATILYRPRTETFSWNGVTFSLACNQASAPVYRYHAIEDGDDATLCGDYDRALASYQRAIFDEQLLGWKEILFYDPPIFIDTEPDPDPNERPRLSAYARYRIMLLHFSLGYLEAAEIVYDTLQEKFPSGTVGHPYAELARVFWEEYEESQTMSTACAQAIDFASAHRGDILTPLSSEYYYYAVRHNQPEDICPFK